MSDAQLSLALSPPRARRRDPETSKEAAARVPEFAANHYGVIVLASKDRGPMTVSEIAAATGLLECAINKRTVELQRAQAIRVQQDAEGNDVKRRGASGC